MEREKEGVTHLAGLRRTTSKEQKQKQSPGGRLEHRQGPGSNLSAVGHLNWTKVPPLQSFYVLPHMSCSLHAPGIIQRTGIWCDSGSLSWHFVENHHLQAWIRTMHQPEHFFRSVTNCISNMSTIWSESKWSLFSCMSGMLPCLINICGYWTQGDICGAQGTVPQLLHCFL